MIKSVLVPVAGSEDDKARLHSALAVARPFGAHIDALHVQPDATQLAMAVASTGYEGGASMTPALIEQLKEDAQRRFAVAQKAFSAFVEEQHIELRETANGSGSVSVAWIQQSGHPGERVAKVARFHDLIVAGRSSPAMGGASGTLETALMKSGRPVVVVPPYLSDVVARIVAIAWKESAEAARAVTAAMPFLAQAARVEVIEVIENGATDDGEADGSAERVVDHLAWHGIAAKARVAAAKDLSGPDALLNAARDAGADLLVMGAYGHSRLRETIFGGFTRRMLQAADLPVLMLH
jgi:nucleotide-binding universal stress UspA family protein